MCGIAGFCLNPNDNINARKLAKHLLLGIEERGRDATGAAWRNRHGNIAIQKKDIKASDFVGHLSLDKKATLAVLHTRMWTQGEPTNPLNNHPIVAGDIVGVHNGYLSNDGDLLKEAAKHGYVRQGEVDSEAIFATINMVDVDKRPKVTLVDALEGIEAKMAAAWIDLDDLDDNTLHLARGDGSPLVVAQTSNGSLVFASTADAIKRAAKALGLSFPYMEHVKEGVYLMVKNGIVTDQEKFFPTPAWGYYGGRSTTVYTGSGTTTTTTTSGNAVTRNHNTSYLDLRYLDRDTEVEEITSTVFASQYKTRTEAIEQWLERNSYCDPMTGELASDEDTFTRAAERGAFLRPGNWVSTWVQGEYCQAQVYRLPKTFPEGDYILRVLVPDYDEAGEVVDFEPILLARTVDNIDGPDLHWSIREEAPKELTA